MCYHNGDADGMFYSEEHVVEQMVACVQRPV